MDTLKLYEDLAQALAPEAARKIAGALGAVYEELRQSVTRADFAELRAVVADLAEAQSRTEERLSRLERAVSKLAEAQSRTEQRVQELAEAQSRTELEVRALTRSLKATRERVAGLFDSVGLWAGEPRHRAASGSLGGRARRAGAGPPGASLYRVPRGGTGRGEYPRGRPKG
jgi:chromosome segregation ATPase